jgi:hypothetical protein
LEPERPSYEEQKKNREEKEVEDEGCQGEGRKYISKGEEDSDKRETQEQSRKQETHLGGLNYESLKKEVLKLFSHY